MSEEQQAAPQPPQMSDTPEKVLAWGEHLHTAWLANPDDERAWERWKDYLVDWGCSLLKLGRQAREPMTLARALETNELVTAWAFKEAMGEDPGPVPEFDLAEALEATRIIDAHAFVGEPKPIFCDPRLLAAMFVMNQYRLRPWENKDTIIKAAGVALMSIRASRRCGPAPNSPHYMQALAKIEELEFELSQARAYEAELAAAAETLQMALPIGKVKAIGLREVAAGVRELAAENARLRQDATQVFVESMKATDGGVDIQFRSQFAQVLAAGFAEMLDGAGAVNFVTMTVMHPDKGNLYMTVGRAEGRTPEERLGELEVENASLKEINTGLSEEADYASALTAENEVLKAALAFYADRATYQAPGHPQINADQTPIVQDSGTRAREALEGEK